MPHFCRRVERSGDGEKLSDPLGPELELASWVPLRVITLDARKGEGRRGGRRNANLS